MFFLAALSVLDGFVPMLPAEAFVVALCILQPQRGKVIVLLFAVYRAVGLSWRSGVVLHDSWWRWVSDGFKRLQFFSLPVYSFKDESIQVNKTTFSIFNRFHHMGNEMKYLDILGHKTWVSVADNDRDRLVLLHGGLSSSSDQMAIGKKLENNFCICAFDRRGHGRTADTPEPFHYESMADETIAFLEAIGGASHLVGWSDGGNIGLIVAMRLPDLVKRLVVIGSNFHHEGVLGGTLTDEAEQMLTKDYADNSPDGPKHRAEVTDKCVKMWQTEPTITIKELSKIQAPVLVLAGDDDMIKLSHTCTLYESIPGAQLAVIPGASHLLPLEQSDKVANIVNDFLTQQLPVVTMMPSRRK